MKARIEDGVVYSPFPSVDIPVCSAYATIKDGLAKRPEQLALVDDVVCLTRRQLFVLMQRFAAGFQQHGVGPGDRVCMHLSNSVENLAAGYGCVFAGATLVLAKPSLTERELHYQLSDSDSTHVLADAKFAPKVRKATSSLSIRGLFSMGTADGFVSADSFKDLDEGTFQECPTEDPRNNVMFVVYTSGTTGLPKGVEHTHYGFVANHYMSRPCMASDETDVVLSMSPIAHASGLSFALMTVLDGSVCVIAPPRLTLPELAAVIKKHHVTSTFFFASYLRSLIEEMRSTGERLGTLRRIAVAGQPLLRATRDEAFQVFGGLQCLMNMYCMTESGGIICSPSMGEANGTDMGFPGTNVQLKVVNQESRQKLGPNEIGELCFRIPTVMRGYYNKPKETAEFFEGDGWCRSGDAGYYDIDGRFYFVQRLKEMIKCMDNQVVPAELEQLLLEKHCDLISDVAVVGLPHPQYGEAPAAAIVLKDGRRDKEHFHHLAEKIKATITENLAVHKHLYGGVFFLDSLPKNETGKINRSVLAETCTSMTSL